MWHMCSAGDMFCHNIDTVMGWMTVNVPTVQQLHYNFVYIYWRQDKKYHLKKSVSMERKEHKE